MVRAESRHRNIAPKRISFPILKEIRNPFNVNASLPTYSKRNFSECVGWILTWRPRVAPPNGSPAPSAPANNRMFAVLISRVTATFHSSSGGCSCRGDSFRGSEGSRWTLIWFVWISLLRVSRPCSLILSRNASEIYNKMFHWPLHCPMLQGISTVPLHCWCWDHLEVPANKTTHPEKNTREVSLYFVKKLRIVRKEESLRRRNVSYLLIFYNLFVADKLLFLLRHLCPEICPEFSLEAQFVPTVLAVFLQRRTISCKTAKL